MSRAAVRKYKTAATLTTKIAPAQVLELLLARIDIEPCRRSQLNDLSGMNVAAGPDFSQQLLAGRVVQIQNRERGSARLISAQLHGGDIYIMIAQDCYEVGVECLPYII